MTILFGATIAGIAAALVWVSVASPATSTTAAHQSRAAAAAPAATSYSIFASAASRLNAAAPGWRTLPDRVGAKMAEARVISQDTTRTVVAVPAAKAPCLVERFANGSESASCPLAAGQQPTSVSYSGAIGLVPDAVDSVTLTMTDGTTRIVPVKNNVWTAPDTAGTAEYSIAGRRVAIELMPRSSMPPNATTDPTQAPYRGPDSTR